MKVSVIRCFAVRWECPQGGLRGKAPDGRVPLPQENLGLGQGVQEGIDPSPERK